MNSEKAVAAAGTGFFGSHLTDELPRRDYQGLIVDNFSSGNNKAAIPSVSGSIEKPQTSHKVDATRTFNILKGAPIFNQLFALPTMSLRIYISIAPDRTQILNMRRSFPGSYEFSKKPASYSES